MTPAAQRNAIAEACGWKKVMNKFGGGLMGWENPPNDHWYLDPPDYLNDLNAMHEAEEKMDGSWMVYEGCLRRVLRGNPICHATASQRAEAFLRALDKWEESDE